MTGYSFAELQEAFQKAILSNDDSVLCHLSQGGREDRDLMLRIYRTAYFARLEEILQNDHEALFSYLGETAFSQMAQAYIEAHPSDQTNARWFSRHLPKFVKRCDRFSNNPEVAELTRLENALNFAFDCADAPTATLEDLSKFPPEVWDRLRFIPHSSVVRLDFSTNAADIWLALKDQDTPPKPETMAERIIVWRSENTPMMRKLGPEEAMAWDETAKGTQFGPLCELIAFHDDPEAAPTRAATYLQGWLTGGLISSANLPESIHDDLDGVP